MGAYERCCRAPYEMWRLCAQAMIDEGKLPLLQQMYREWPFFSVTLDMVEMVFAKADPRVAQACPSAASQFVCQRPPPFSSIFSI